MADVSAEKPREATAVPVSEAAALAAAHVREVTADQRPQGGDENQIDDLVWVCRSARLSQPAYRFYCDILRTFPERGRAPTPTEVAQLAARYHVSLQATLAQLALQDLLQRDSTTGAIRAAYPFSGPPTAHRVCLAETSERPATTVFAMCAIDALGIPLMIRRAATITSADGLTGEPVRVVVTPAPATVGQPDATVQWEPEAAVVYARLEDHEHEHDCGSEAAGACCPITNFFISEAHAQKWAASSPHADGRVFSQGEALRYAARLFGGVLDRISNRPGTPLT